MRPAVLVSIVITLAAVQQVARADRELRVAVLGQGLQSSEFSTKHDDVTSFILHHVVESLVAYDDELAIAPMLAESWSVADAGRRYRFVLRDDVRFHNGRRMTASDVAWNWHRFRDPGRDWGSHCREWYDGSAQAYHRPVTIVSVTADDDANTVTFRLQSRNSMFLHHIASNHCISGIVHPESVDAAGQWQQAIGTGPYRLVEAGSEGSARLERFEGYTSRSEASSGLAGGKRASIDSLVFRPFASADTALVALKEGRVHFLHDLPFHKLEEVTGAADLKYVIQETPAWHQIIIQSRFDSLLNKLAMRKAIAHSLDPEALKQELFGAAVGVNHSAVASSSGYHRGIHDEGYLRDAATVEAWLKEAGYRGEALTIQASRTPYPLFYAVAEKAAEQLRKSGINARVEEVSWPEQDANYANNEYQLTSMTFSARTDPALMYSALVGQKSDHSWYLWEDNEAAALVSLATVESQPEKRRQLFDRLHEKMLDWAPTVGLFNYPRVHVMSTELTGYRPWALAYPRFWLAGPLE